jgi:hypothetical protein
VSVEDVPDDEGGQVTVQWVRSGYDIPGIASITDYVIQRSLPPGISGWAWENMTTVQATQDPQYACTVETLYDSSSTTDGRFYLRVMAQTSWKSCPVSGYSVDNTASGGSSLRVAAIPSSVQLMGSVPNPFNVQTVITYGIPAGGGVHLVVYNTCGQKVTTLLDTPMDAGYGQVVWDGRDDEGRALASGVYLCRLTSEGDMVATRLVLMK